MFIYSLKVYKYHVFSFNLTNDFFNYQHYINDILFEFFNEFIQFYLKIFLFIMKLKKNIFVTLN